MAELISPLITFLIVSMSFFVGYWLGSGKKVDVVDEVKRFKQKIDQSKIKPGPLMRPSSKQIDRRQNKTLYEGIDETKKLFDEIYIENGSETKNQP